MTTLSLIYKDKDQKGTNITTRKTYLLGVDELIERGTTFATLTSSTLKSFAMRSSLASMCRR